MMDNFYVCPRCAAAADRVESRLDADEDRAGEEIYAAADREIDGLERKIEVLESRLTAADALAVALKEVEWDEGGHCLWCYGWERTGGHSLDCQRQEALRKYREVSE